MQNDPGDTVRPIHVRQPRLPLRTTLPAFGLTLSLVLSGCSMVSHYSTAKLARKGEFQVTPSATVKTINIRANTGGDGDDDDVELKGSGSSIGAAAAYGVTDAFNIALRYEHFPNNGDKYSHFVYGELKVSVEEDETAMSFGYGHLVGSEIHQLSLNSYHNFSLGNKVEYCFSPQGTVLIFSGGPYALFDATLNNSLSLPLSKNVTLIPQVGVAVIPLLIFTGVVFNFGIATRITF